MSSTHTSNHPEQAKPSPEARKFKEAIKKGKICTCWDMPRQRPVRLGNNWSTRDYTLQATPHRGRVLGSRGPTLVMLGGRMQGSRWEFPSYVLQRQESSQGLQGVPTSERVGHSPLGKGLPHKPGRPPLSPLSSDGWRGNLRACLGWGWRSKPQGWVPTRLLGKVLEMQQLTLLCTAQWVPVPFLWRRRIGTGDRECCRHRLLHSGKNGVCLT